MLIFIKPNNAKQTEPKVMEQWQAYLTAQLGDSLLSLTPCPKKSSCVYSLQPHSGTDYGYKVRHIPITFCIFLEMKVLKMQKNIKKLLKILIEI